MAKKAKKRILVPVICILLALCAVLAVTVYTTPVCYTLYEAFYTYSDNEKDIPKNFEMSRKIGSITESVYKSRPTIDNLLRVAHCYMTDWYIWGTYAGEEVPKGYLEKSLKYSKLKYEEEYKEEYVKKFEAVPVSDKNETLWKIQNGMEYAKALYLNGDFDEAKRVCEEMLGLLTKLDASFPTFGLFRSFFYLVYSDSKVESQKAWVLEKEKALDDFYKSAGEYEKYFSQHDSFFTNPTYDEYASGNWPEYRDGFINYDD